MHVGQPCGLQPAPAIWRYCEGATHIETSESVVDTAQGYVQRMVLQRACTQYIHISPIYAHVCACRRVCSLACDINPCLARPVHEQPASRNLHDTKSCRHAGWGKRSPCSLLRCNNCCLQTIAQHQQSRQTRSAGRNFKLDGQCIAVHTCVPRDDAVLLRHCSVVLLGHECVLLLLLNRVSTPTATGLILCPPASTHSTGQHSGLQQRRWPCTAFTVLGRAPAAGCH